jgi:hypothetical protein
MIRARRLEAWLSDWFEDNPDPSCTVGKIDGEVVFLDDKQDIFSISLLAKDLAVALAEAGLERD